MKIVENVCLVS